jgi:DNA invertase Pin-like site-specific DNA recombinase
MMKAPGNGAQLDALHQAGCTRIFTEAVSGAAAARPELTRALDYLRPGEDTLVVWKLDRLARSLRQLIDTVERLQAQRIGFLSLTEALDTSTPGGMMLFHVVGAFAQFERVIIQERARAGLQAARAQGRGGGRPRAMTAMTVRTMMATLREKAMSVSALARELGIHRATVYDYVTADGRPTALGRAVLQGKACADESQAAD